MNNSTRPIYSFWGRNLRLAAALSCMITGFTGTSCKKTEDDPAPVSQDRNEGAAEPQAAPQPSSQVELAVRIARAISASPDQADQILEKNKINREQLDTIMYQIAADPKLRQAFLKARQSPPAGR